MTVTDGKAGMKRTPGEYTVHCQKSFVWQITLHVTEDAYCKALCDVKFSQIQREIVGSFVTYCRAKQQRQRLKFLTVCIPGTEDGASTDSARGK